MKSSTTSLVGITAILAAIVLAGHEKHSKTVIDHQYENFQDALMLKLFSHIDENIMPGIHDLPFPYDRYDHHIQCKHGLVRGLEIRIHHLGNLRLQYLPNTLEWVQITSCDQHYPIETRFFPRDLILLSLEENHVYGKVNLSTLPCKIVKLNLANNAISGPISLCHLPHSLECLRIINNAIRQKTVFYANLPENIERIDLRGNDIKQAQNLFPEDGSMRGERILFGKGYLLD